jgi:hypothetical protein
MCDDRFERTILFSMQTRVIKKASVKKRADDWTMQKSILWETSHQLWPF